MKREKILIGAGAIYLAYHAIRSQFKASSKCLLDDELNGLISKLDRLNNISDKADILGQISASLKSRPPGSVPLRPEQIQTISRSLLDSQTEVKTKCYHALQSVLHFAIDPDEGTAVLQFTRLLLSLFSDTEAIEEQLACLTLLVSLSSHRDTHPDLIRSLSSYCSLLHTQPPWSREVRLVTQLLFRLSENRSLLDTLLNCRVDRWWASVLHPSSPRETLLYCLTLLTNLSRCEPPGGAKAQQYNEASMYTLLYSRPTPLLQALRPLAWHSDPRVKAAARYMLSRLPLPGYPAPPGSWAWVENGSTARQHRRAEA
ncbi:hypothetical protein DPEC_G00014780 [Dallia pectoralis]|uniref:Uncharacterized protein n=1 Tax=Dallia pectoralis TaxID=75939 RepID=A0ACC2HN62_DALPE|nr:hypothetical protein DPEC_G00014780 [Dallia pectoralis]